MGCDDNTCGTGGWSGPLPGDPDNNSILTATPAFGGIDINWTYPTVNPYAVSYVTLYRGILPDFNSAIVIAQIGGTFFYDKQDNSNRYYYWIRFMSVNGTEGDLIGPASATARPTIEQVIEQLTGKIDAGVLAQSLKQEIDKITLNHAELISEIANRVASDAVVSAALANVQRGVDQSLAYVNQEITTRKSADSALASQVNVVAAATNSNLAAIIEERTTRTNADSALSTSLSTVTALSQQNAAAILAETSARVTATDSLAKQITSVSAATASNAAALVNSEVIARTNADNALASSIQTAQSTLNGNITSVRTEMLTNVSQLSGAVTSLGALYSVKVSANGLVGGFGIYNDGTSIEAGFDVDTFWVGKTNANKRKPFIISGNQTYIDEAAINRLTFSKLRSEDGAVIVENGQLKANYIDTRGLVIRDAVGNPIFGAGVPLNWASVTGKPNFGALAYQNNAVVGGTIVFPDGSLLGQSDFVNRLSKINVNNIGVYMEAASIGSAFIGNLAVQTLNIAGGAVSANNAAQGASGTCGAGGQVDVAAVGVDIGTSGNQGITITITAGLNSGQNCTAQLMVLRNGTPIYNSGISLSGGFGTNGIGAYFDRNPSPGWNVYTFRCWNDKQSSDPGSNRSFNFIAPIIIVAGAKR